MSRRIRILGSALALSLAGCHSEPHTQSPAPVAATESAAPLAALVPSEHGALAEPYPPGRWRLVPQDELDHSVLWLAHILIRHEEVQSAHVSFDPTNRRWELPVAQRTRRQAFELAQQLASQAASEPASFPALARQFSEDPATRDSGGSLGGITALQFVLDPNLLDTFAALNVGSISRPVETEQGFHVFWRRPAPPSALLTGARLVIGHRDSPWLEQSARRPIPDRSRSEALALATRLYEQAQRDPDSFEQLVAQYSEHVDADSTGDFGTWSTREPTPFPIEIETLQGLRIGEVAPPFDSCLGIQVIRRVPNRPRMRSSIVGVRLPVDPSKSAPPEARRDAVLAQLRSFQASVQSDPARFRALQVEYCCDREGTVIEGRDEPALVALLARLTPGQVAPEPVELSDHSYLLPKLLSRRPHQPESARDGLPSSPALDFDYWLPLFEKSALRQQLAQLGARSGADLGLPAETAQQLLREHELAAQLADGEGSERLQRFQLFLARVRQLLGPDDFERYWRLCQQDFEKLLLGT